ncbi:MAG: hypothetical protein LBU32_05770 [Clostridiales bacterium]|nr:hypothetical protein [Clostridiales bacterium]
MIDVYFYAYCGQAQEGYRLARLSSAGMAPAEGTAISQEAKSLLFNEGFRLALMTSKGRTLLAAKNLNGKNRNTGIDWFANIVFEADEANCPLICRLSGAIIDDFESFQSELIDSLTTSSSGFPFALTPGWLDAQLLKAIKYSRSNGKEIESRLGILLNNLNAGKFQSAGKAKIHFAFLTSSSMEFRKNFKGVKTSQVFESDSCHAIFHHLGETGNEIEEANKSRILLSFASSFAGIAIGVIFALIAIFSEDDDKKRLDRKALLNR